MDTPPSVRASAGDTTKSDVSANRVWEGDAAEEFLKLLRAKVDDVASRTSRLLPGVEMRVARLRDDVEFAANVRRHFADRRDALKWVAAFSVASLFGIAQRLAQASQPHNIVGLQVAQVLLVSALLSAI